MDWNGGNLRVPYVTRPESSFSFLYNYNYDQFPVLEMKQPMVGSDPQLNLPGILDKNSVLNMNYIQDPKKKRLSNEQLDLLESSFQEEIKLDPERKMKLAKDLGLQPRQIAVWFQNRRARWKAKQLERLYDALKQEYNNVSRDKQKLQKEVLSLRAILKDQVGKKAISTGYADQVSVDETDESTSAPCSEKLMASGPNPECNPYSLNVDDYNNSVMMPPAYWPPPPPPPQLPSCP